MLKAQGYETGEINEIANMAFITGQTNRRISNKEATGYLADIVAKQGEAALSSQCVPTDPALWTTDRYREFLQVRREELAKRMNAIHRGEGGAVSQFAFLQREWPAVFDAAAQGRGGGARRPAHGLLLRPPRAGAGGELGLQARRGAQAALPGQPLAR